MIWLCAPCNAYVGTHENSPDNKPLGTLADPELRQLRMQCHKLFDSCWAYPGFRHGLPNRKQAYAQLDTLHQPSPQTGFAKSPVPVFGSQDLAVCETRAMLDQFDLMEFVQSRFLERLAEMPCISGSPER
jgi:hypothetical protein